MGPLDLGPSKAEPSTDGFFLLDRRDGFFDFVLVLTAGFLALVLITGFLALGGGDKVPCSLLELLDEDEMTLRFFRGRIGMSSESYAVRVLVAVLGGGDKTAGGLLGQLSSEEDDMIRRFFGGGLELSSESSES